MIFGKHINRYYLKYAPMLLLGLAALVAVDYLQLVIPNLYQMVVNGISQGYVDVEGTRHVFDMAFLLERICMPMVGIILCVVVGRFLWRVAFFGAAIRVETDLRNRMFDNARNLSRQYYQVNKVGNLMSLFTNDLDTVQECYGWGIMMFFDALLMGVLAVTKMWRMDPLLTVLSLIPMGFLLASATVVGRYMMKKWDIRQAAFSKLSDFSQESFSGIAVIKAFVKEAKELMAFKKLNVENENANMDHTKASVLMRILVTVFVESVICVILGYGGYLVYQDRFNAGQLVEFIGYFNAVIWPIMAVSELIDMTSRGKASLQRIGELLDRCIRENGAEDFGAAMMADTIVVQAMILINRLYRKMVQGDRRGRSGSLVSSVLEYINNHYADELTLDSLANRFFISKYHMMRRFREETGYTTDTLIDIGPLATSPALLTEIIYCYLAEDMTEGETDPDPDEFLEMVKIPLEDMVDMILRGEIQDAKTQSAVLKVWAMKNR